MSAPMLRIKLEREIGRGAHSRVKLGRDLDTFESLAVKVITLDKSGQLVFDTELSLLRLLPEHRNIPRLYGHYVTKHNKGCIVMEYLPFPSLKSFVESSGALNEGDAVFILIDVLHYMTARGVAHCDLKGDNIIINPDTLIIKLIDFGLGTEIEGENSVDDTYRGTPVYMAPEILREGLSFSVVAAEMWSIGMIFWECLTGMQPFLSSKSKRELLSKQAIVSELYAPLPPKQRALLDAMLAHNPKQRFSIRAMRDKVDELYPLSIPDRLTRSCSTPLQYSVSRSRTFDSIYEFLNSPDPTISFARNPEAARSSMAYSSLPSLTGSEARKASRGR